MPDRIGKPARPKAALLLVLCALLASATSIPPAEAAPRHQGEITGAGAPQTDCDLCQALPGGYETTSSGCLTAYYANRSISVELWRELTREEAGFTAANDANNPGGGLVGGLGDRASERPVNPDPGAPYRLTFSRHTIVVEIDVKPDSGQPDLRSRANALAHEIDSGLLKMVAAGCWQAVSPVPSIPEAASTPAPTATVDLTIDHVEVVQVIQVPNEADELPLVADKKSVVRVFVKATGPPGMSVSGVTAALFVRPDGGSEAEAGPASNSPITVSTNDEPDMRSTNSSLNFLLPPNLTAAGTYSVTVRLNPGETIPETDSSNNDYVRTVKFVDRNGLRVGFVRVGMRPPGETEWAWPQGQMDTYAELMKKLYPAGGGSVQYYEMPWRIRWPSAITTRLEGEKFNWQLRDFYDALQGDKPDILVAWLSDTYIGIATGGIAETVPSQNVPRVAWLLDSNLRSPSEMLPHELGHNLGLEHTATTADPDAECGFAPNDNLEYWPREYGNSATIHVIGFDTEEMRAIPSSYYDVMSYCSGSIWISPFHYKKLYDSNMRPQGGSSTWGSIRKWWVRGSVKKQASEPQLELVRPPYENTGGAARPSLAAGTSSMGAGVAADLILPLHVAAASWNAPVREGEGDYCVRFTEAGGSILYERCFDLQFRSADTTEPLDEQGFALDVPDLGSEVSQVALWFKDRQLVARSASGHPPSVSITSPEEGDRWEGEHTITWSGSDADGDSIRYDILYSPDGKESWYPLEIGSHDTQYTFSTGEILPSDQTYIRMLASDGFETAYADAGPFTVPEQPESPDLPPAPGVTNPVEISPSGSDRVFPDWWPLAFVGGIALLGAALVIAVLLRGRSARRPAARAPLPAGQWTGQIPPAQSFAEQFRWAEAEYRRLRNELAAGRISGEQFNAAARRLSVRDAWGRFWALGVGDGQWYVYDGRNWVRANPG